jgi:carbonic anhydrase
MFVSSRHSPRQPRSIKADVEKVVSSPLTAAGIPVHGYLYDVRTGKINHVVSAVTK